ncbi:FAD-dependent oxidoreductase [Actinorhabdospora filicis]|uniref:FAD-dependent oxidoreductase n=1 Tax=Actinorhabdospora filicis TaxID=1785913 RepID=A0A9W6SND0_9ACTN|nr:FAD-dependent monooxygenase [Actinorhabdospora filicis]GLZ79138.1 FAD-dependent oxidoreductase [Actinorhabdospora filicis]
MEPVAIAGGGPVGLAAALFLARRGVPAVVLETAERREAAGSRSICVQREVLDALHRAGCGEVLAREGVTWTHGRTYHRHRELFRITFPETVTGFPPFVNIPQWRVEEVLEAAVRSAGVEIRYGTPVTGLAQDGGVTVRTGRGTLRASHLIGADGGHSAVRDALGLDFPGESFGDRFLIADIRAELPFGPQRRFHFDPEWNPGRQVLLHPQPDSVWRIDWQVPGDFDLAGARASGEVDRRIRLITGGLPYEIVWLSSYRFAQRAAPSFAEGRVLLAGDAAHVMSPFGARGLNSGIADAENAAWKIALDRAGLAGPALLPSYHHERRAAALENLRVTGATMRFLVPRTPEEAAHREDVLTRAASGDAGALAQVDSGRLYAPHSYARSPLTTPRDGLAVAPGDVCPDEPHGSGRLREHLGDFALLHTGDAPAAPVPALRVSGEALDARPGRVWLARPDGHLAAVLDDPAPGEIAAALRRARGFR